MDPNITRLIDFWFKNANPERWFKRDADLDLEIESTFGSLVEQARDTGSIDSWTETSRGTLAILILLDQFPRNVYRGSPDSWASDPKALSIAVNAVAKGDELSLPLIQQPFFYLPLMHDEKLISQVAAKALYEGYVQRCNQEPEDSLERTFSKRSLQSCIEHMQVIQTFGQFPSRNDVLKRQSTEEEVVFLEEHPGGF